MSVAKITVFGLYKWDSHLFDLLKVPEDVNKDTLIETILLNCGEFEPLYADGDFFKMAIGSFSNKWQDTFIKWNKLLKIEFNPLYNYDRYEEFEDVHKGKSTTSNISTNSGTVENTGTETRTNEVSAYNSSVYEPNEQNTLEDDLTQTTNINGTNTTNADDTKNISHRAHLYGNIGVTRSTEMAMEYQNEYAVWNIYEHIADLFKTELTIAVY